MSKELIKEVKEFLRNSNLSNYEINTYITLLNSNNLTAREISNKSNVPTGRIYEILEGLKDKGMIEIQESRPKIFRAISFNQASHDLIAHIRSRQQRKTSFLLNQAKQLETKINNSYLSIRQESSKIFWSTAYGWQPIVKLYKKKFNTLQENLLMTGFLNENTLKVLPYAKDFYEGILNALNRKVQVKYLWSFEYDERSLLDEQKRNNFILFEELTKKMKDLFKLSSKIDGFEMRFIQKKIPTLYDIFDNTRVLIKLQNPLKPWEIFACINVLDPILAEELTKKYENIWLLEAKKGKK